MLLANLALPGGGGADTARACTAGTFWEEMSQACVAPEKSRLTDAQLLVVAREFAHSGAYADAVAVLGAVSDQQDGPVLAILAFAHWGLGDVKKSNAYFTDALARDPDNLLARSYLGQVYVSEGKISLASAQLSEIRARGGRQSLAEFTLRQAIETRSGYSY
ncbi:MAG: tetratricopeptide repeat protein [Pseudomonadota bacterium]